MADDRYWLVVTTLENWEAFLSAGAGVYGFSDRYQATVSRTQIGDYLICYTSSGVSRFSAVLRVISRPFRDPSFLWMSAPYPVRLNVEPVLMVNPLNGVPVQKLMSRLSMFRDMKPKASWGNYFFTSIKEWTVSDGRVVCRALEKARRESDS